MSQNIRRGAPRLPDIIFRHVTIGGKRMGLDEVMTNITAVLFAAPDINGDEVQEVRFSTQSENIRRLIREGREAKGGRGAALRRLRENDHLGAARMASAMGFSAWTVTPAKVGAPV